MSIELKMLAWAILLGLVHIFIAATFATRQRGLMWNAGPRDAVMAPLAGVAGRVGRASNNFLETFAFFAAAVLMLTILQRGSEHSALGAQLYFWARVAYLPIYAAGIPFVRSLVWGVALVGLLLVVAALF